MQSVSGPMPTSTLLRTSTIRLGVVRFLNARPLIDGLERLADVQLEYGVPSELIGMLLDDRVDAALCSSIDFQQSPEPLEIVPVGLLGCDGSTMTVRLYATRPLDQLQRVHCDTDSHTSVILLRILLAEQYRCAPEFVDYAQGDRDKQRSADDWPEAKLLIGDKVVTDSPPEKYYPYQLDLGEAWQQLTGKPFVFATWMMRRESDSALKQAVGAVLDHQLRYNRMHLPAIVHEHAPNWGWPLDLAERYLQNHIIYAPEPDRWEGMELFFERALEHDLISEQRPLAFSTCR